MYVGLDYIANAELLFLSYPKSLFNPYESLIPYVIAIMLAQETKGWRQEWYWLAGFMSRDEGPC